MAESDLAPIKSGELEVEVARLRAQLQVLFFCFVLFFFSLIVFCFAVKGSCGAVCSSRSPDQRRFAFAFIVEFVSFQSFFLSSFFSFSLLQRWLLNSPRKFFAINCSAKNESRKCAKRSRLFCCDKQISFADRVFSFSRKNTSARLRFWTS